MAKKRAILNGTTLFYGRGLAEVAEKYLNKGDKILIEGRIRSRSWEDKESGQMRFITEILADQMQMIGSVKKSSEDFNEAQELHHHS